MSIEVHVNTSVSPLWTCIKVLYEHILCIERIECSFFEIHVVVSLFLSLPHTPCLKLSIKLFFLCQLCIFSFCTYSFTIFVASSWVLGLGGASAILI